MINGDISNETPPRIIVLVDVVVESVVEDTRKLLRTTTERKVLKLNNATLSSLWNTSFKFGLAIELAAFESDLWTQDHLDKLMARLDSRGGNPFNYSELYSSVEDFVGELPYRSNLKGVVDVPERAGRYGSWRLDLNNL